MKIGICAYPLSSGKETGRGLERVVEEFLSYLSERKVSFDFYDNGIIHSELKAVLFSFSYLRKLRHAQNTCYLAIYAVSGIFPAFMKKKPQVTIITDLIPFHVTGYDSKWKYAIKRWCVKYSCLRSDRLIVGSVSIKNEISVRFSIDPARISVVPWGVNHKTYYKDNRIEKIKNRIAFLGEAKRAKGIDSIIKAFKYVLEQVPDATLSLASNGYELDKMKKLAAELLPENSYDFEGFIPEDAMNGFYNSADLFVFPSRYGFGLSALEAMACGVPTFIGDTLDAKDFFLDKDMLVDPDDEKLMAGKIIYLLLNENIKNTKSLQALQVAKQYSWDEMSRKYLEVCLDVVNKPIV